MPGFPVRYKRAAEAPYGIDGRMCSEGQCVEAACGLLPQLQLPMSWLPSLCLKGMLYWLLVSQECLKRVEWHTDVVMDMPTYFNVLGDSGCRW